MEPSAGPVRLVVTASDTLTAPNGRLTFAAQAEDQEGRVVATEAVAWSVSDTLRGRIGPDGAFVGGPWVGRLYVRAALATPELADSVAVRIVPPGTVKWTWAAASVGRVMPIVGGPALGRDGTVYVLPGTADWTQAFPGTLVALAPDGTVRWTRELRQVEGSTGIVVTPEPERLWIVGQRLYLVSTSGEVLWDSLTAAVASIALAGAATPNYLVAAQGKQLAVYAAADHTWAWETPFAPLSDWLVPPTITAQGHILGKRTEDTLFVFDAADGRIHRFFLDPDTAIDKRVVGRGTVPVADRYYLPTEGRVAAYDTSGPLLWLTQDRGHGVSEPAVDRDGTLYVQHRRFGLEAMTPDGTTKWYRRTVHPLGWGWNEQPFYGWYGGAALARGGIIYAAAQGGVFAFDTSGTLLWKHVADSAGGPQPFLGAPAIAPDGTIYTWTSTHVYAFWGSEPPEPMSPWPMWRHDAQRTGWAAYRP